MWTSSCKAKNIESRRLELLEKGFEVLSKKSIESVAMQDVADAVGCGIASLYRYFDKKPGFVVAVATWKNKKIKKVNSVKVTAVVNGASRPFMLKSGQYKIAVKDGAKKTVTIAGKGDFSGSVVVKTK